MRCLLGVAGRPAAVKAAPSASARSRAWRARSAKPCAALSRTPEVARVSSISQQQLAGLDHLAFAHQDLGRPRRRRATAPPAAGATGSRLRVAARHLVDRAPARPTPAAARPRRPPRRARSSARAACAGATSARRPRARSCGSRPRPASSATSGRAAWSSAQPRACARAAHAGCRCSGGCASAPCGVACTSVVSSCRPRDAPALQRFHDAVARAVGHDLAAVDHDHARHHRQQRGAVRHQHHRLVLRERGDALR